MNEAKEMVSVTKMSQTLKHEENDSINSPKNNTAISKAAEGATISSMPDFTGSSPSNLL